MVPVCWTLIGIALVRPGQRIAGALLLAFLWNFWTLVLVNMLAVKLGWWSFHVRGGVFYGLPVDLLLGWSLLWGPLVGLAVLRYPVWLVCMLAIVLDLIVMPACEPAVLLEKSWLLGEFVAVFLCLIPAVIITRLTAQEKWLTVRALFQMLLFSGLFLFFIPLLALQGQTIGFSSHIAITVCLQFLFFTAIPGLSGLQEFLLRGDGTPFPYDPTKKLVTTGPYAYIRNPMQLTNVLLFLVLMLYFREWKLGVAAVISVAYSSGLAWWHETADISRRFGSDWKNYSSEVPLWIPKWKPWRKKSAYLYIAGSCEVCQRVRRWLETLGTRMLEIRPAEDHPDRDLFRITYDDSGFEEEGIAAVGRALEHANFCWAMVGFVMRLSIIRSFLQLLCDEFVAGPRRVKRRPALHKNASVTRE